MKILILYTFFIFISYKYANRFASSVIVNCIELQKTSLIHNVFIRKKTLENVNMKRLLKHNAKWANSIDIFWVPNKNIHLITTFFWFSRILIIMNISNVYSSSKTTQRPQTTENEKVDWLWVVIFIGIIVPIVCFSSFMLYLYRKKRSEFF